jgi:hypothetical protein
MAYENAQNAASPNGVMLGARVEIFPSMPLPDLNTPGGMAFSARFKTEAASDLYAIVCVSGLPPRIEAVQAMRTIDNPCIVRLVESGVVTWSDGARAYAFVYQRPVAPRMMNVLDETRTVLSEDSINHNFITPMIGALVALMNAGVVHNAIRPTNIFWRIGNATPPQIGECLSTPAGMGQPVLFEPVERALAMPLGRGPGLHVDDCYAFGMTLAFLVLGQNPLAGMEDAAIIEAKMQRGTFSVMLGNQRLSSTHIEILRGLLADDSRQRWTAGDLDQWLSGRRMTPKSSDAGRRSSRYFEFAGKEYWQVGPLAMAFAGNVAEAAKTIESESLNKWLRRALNDDDRAADVEMAISDLKQSGKTSNFEEQMVARVCIALDHSAPIRYRGISAMPGGIASLLADAVQTGNNIAPLSEIIASQLVSLWIEMQKDAKAELSAMIQMFERMKGFIEKTTFGNGIERVTYELNTGLPCLSPMLKGQYVTTPKMLLPALERVAASGNRPREPMDRHIAAFLIVRDKRNEALFEAMTAPEGSIRRGTALLTLFSELQYRNGPESTPNLAGWLSPFTEPAVRRFLSKTLRERVQKQIKDAVAVGNLGTLLRMIDDPKRIERDRQDFMAARLLHLNTQKEIASLEIKLNNRESVVRGAGKPMAASISTFLAIILICAAIVRALFEVLMQ